MRRTLAMCALALVAAGSAARGASLPGRGALEVSPSAAFRYASYFSNGDNFSATTLNLDAFVGYFVTDRVELGGSALVSYVSFSGSRTAAGMSGGLTFNFRSGNLAPYLRASVGFQAYDYDFGGSETNHLFPMLEGGARVMIGSTASVNFAVVFQHQSHPDGSTTLEADTILLGVGVSIFPVRGTE
jgi:hypothetical protein